MKRIKKILKRLIGIGHVLMYSFLVIPAGLLYLIVDNWRNMKRKRHRHHLHRIGRATEHNPFTDKY